MELGKLGGPMRCNRPGNWAGEVLVAGMTFFSWESEETVVGTENRFSGRRTSRK